MQSEKQEKQDERIAEYLIVDSGGFLRNAPLGSLGIHIVSTADVVAEIKDKETLKRLQVLPYDLELREPSTEAIQKVSDFARKCGDYSVLSATDLKLLALTYDVEKELHHGNVDHLKTAPTMQKSTTFYNPAQQQQNKDNAPGFYNGHGNNNEEDNTEVDIVENNLSDEVEKIDISKEGDVSRDKVEISISKEKINDIENEEDAMNTTSSCSGGTEEEDLEISDDDDDSWITPSNFKEKQKQMLGGKNDNEKPQFVKVACMTTDFAMQNVLKSMGMNVISVDGLFIKETKTWILRCYSCFKTTHLMHKQFCPKCGNKTLKRVSVTVDDDGSQQIHISTRRQLTGKGKKFSLPKPQGGKHSVNPILCEDQNMAQQRRSRMAYTKTDVMHPDYIAGNSPFALHDVTSKSAIIGTPGVGEMNNMYWMKKNPNSSGKSTGNRKKKNRK